MAIHRRALRVLVTFCFLSCCCLAFTKADREPIASLHGDPHFQGADGIHFDFTGKPGTAYCLFTHPSVHINMGMAGREVEGKGIRTWVKALGILSGSHSVELHARDGAAAERGEGFMEHIRVDGRPARIPEGKRLRTRDGALSLEFVGHVALDGDDEVESYLLITETGLEILMKLRAEGPENRQSDDAHVHFSVEVLEAPGVSNPHGVMGQTFREEQKQRTFTFRTEWSPHLQVWQVAGPNGVDYLDGQVDDYATSDLMKADCKFSQFRQQESGQSVNFQLSEERGEAADPLVKNVETAGDRQVSRAAGADEISSQVAAAEAAIGEDAQGDDAPEQGRFRVAALGGFRDREEAGKMLQEKVTKDERDAPANGDFSQESQEKTIPPAAGGSDLSGEDALQVVEELVLAADGEKAQSANRRKAGAQVGAEAERQEDLARPADNSEQVDSAEAQENGTETMVAEASRQGAVEGQDEGLSSSEKPRPLHVFRALDGSLQEEAEPEAQDREDQAETLAGLEAAVLEELPVRTLRAHPRKLLSDS